MIIMQDLITIDIISWKKWYYLDLYILDIPIIYFPCIGVKVIASASISANEDDHAEALIFDTNSFFESHSTVKRARRSH